MLNRIEFKNLQAVSLNDIPDLTLSEFSEQLISETSENKRIIQFFGEKLDSKTKLYSIWADDHKSKLFAASTTFHNQNSYPSLTQYVPSLHLFEREFYEQFGIKPDGHPWLKPIRKGITGISENENKYRFIEMTGEEVHEVGVGPIHAGIIEPGHFRFSCHGEDVYNLEIQHGFQHRGVEELIIKNRTNHLYLLKLSESIAGDSVVGHAESFAQAMESLAGVTIGRKAILIRTIALELERVAIHLGDLAGLSTDIAYLTGNAVFSAFRTKVINATMSICGSRFGRGLIALGGVNYNITDELINELKKNVESLISDVELASEVLFSAASVLSRFEKTGIVTTESAKILGLVGPAGRASGISLDVRADHPFGGYALFPIHKINLNSGDVFARAYIRYIEIMQSLKLIKEVMDNLNHGEIKNEFPKIRPNQFVVSMVEGWRGEIVHTAITDESGILRRYKIKDPSFHNWTGLSIALRNNVISDFPVCNKSFNLSYSGMDL